MSADEDIGTMVGRVIVGALVVLAGLVAFIVWAIHHVGIA